MILVIDNYDSFTYNLVQYLGELGAKPEVVRNDAVDLSGISAMRPERIVISPGPGTPDDAGVSLEVIRGLGSGIPILGVCLGHQAIGQVFGGQVVRAPVPMHGKVSTVTHGAHKLFRGINGPFQATRYHSLVIERASAPDELEVTAEADGLIMAMSHRSLNVHGVQFHPESIASEHGRTILANFLDLARTH